MKEYKIMFSSDSNDSIKLWADTFDVTDDIVTFKCLNDDTESFEPVAVFKMIDIVGFYRSF